MTAEERAAFADMRDVSMSEARRLLGCSWAYLEAVWDSIPTAYRMPAGKDGHRQGRVSIRGLRLFQDARGARSNEEARSG